VSRLALLIPARNAGPHLGRLLDSVEAQTEPFDEVWLFDDASEDGTGRMARERGVQVIRSEACVGPSAGKNRLAEATSCDWVHFHDADDALGREFVARARRWMTEPDVDVVLFATEDRDDGRGGGEMVRRWDDAALRSDPVGYAVRQTVTNGGIYRRKAFLRAGGFDVDEAVRYNEDQAMHLRLGLAGLRFRAESYVGVVLYQRPGSMSTAHPIECARAQVEVLRRVARQTGRRYRIEIGERAWHLAAVLAGYSDWVASRQALGLAHHVGYRWPEREHWLVRLAGSVSPWWAIRGREQFIRSFKPHLRVGMPSTSAVAHGLRKTRRVGP
jgi:glycosyltransferase involved in cell wall biosynthesis